LFVFVLCTQCSQFLWIVFVLFVFVLCTQCSQFLWIVFVLFFFVLCTLCFQFPCIVHLLIATSVFSNVYLYIVEFYCIMLVTHVINVTFSVSHGCGSLLSSSQMKAFLRKSKVNSNKL
jgi:hypothetical protein